MSGSEITMTSVIFSDYLLLGRPWQISGSRNPPRLFRKGGRRSSETDGLCGSSLTPGSRGDVKMTVDVMSP